jgi:hypothetical protein
MPSNTLRRSKQSFVAAATLMFCTLLSACASAGVRSSPTFALGGIGVIGAMSEGEKALRAVLAQPEAARELEAMFPHATDAGRLYILVGLRVRDRAAYARALAACSRHDSVVRTIRGCSIGQESFRSLVREIDRGEFDPVIKRPPW